MISYPIDDHRLEVVEEKRILGLIIRSDLKWSSNTKSIMARAYSKLWIIRRLKYLGAEGQDLVDIFCKHVRSVLEFGAPVWHSGLTLTEKYDIERVQKSFCHIYLGGKYESYHGALKQVGLESLEKRREKLCLKFALSAEKSNKFKHWFKPSVKTSSTRLKPLKYAEVISNHARKDKSPLYYLTKLLNHHYKEK